MITAPHPSTRLYPGARPGLLVFFFFCRLHAQTEDGIPVTPQALWMALFLQLAELCTDSRPEIRKSANQTFVATITTHGPRLPLDTWCGPHWWCLILG